MNYEKQLLIENECKLTALQLRMDNMLNECATEEELIPYYDHWCSLVDSINSLKSELSRKN